VAIRAVFFDLDGTLVDSNDMHVLAWQEAFASVGVDFDLQVIHDQIGKGADMLVPTLLPGADDVLQEKLASAHDAVFKAKFLKRVKPIPGAHELLARVHAAGQAVVFASSASTQDLEHYTDLLGARDVVGASTSADEVENTKPAPDIFAAALQKVAPLSASEVIVVGDTPYDIEAAARCGIATVAVRSGRFADAVLRDAGAVAIYNDAAALLADYDQSPLHG
jgi:HAD superfamily hydrolase (TIGR01509 family)